MKGFLLVAFLLTAACTDTGPVVVLPPLPPPASPPSPVPGVFQDVGTLGELMMARGINDAGVVIGMSRESRYAAIMPVLSRNGVVRVLQPDTGGWAAAISQRGIIAGDVLSPGAGGGWDISLWDTSGTRLSSVQLTLDSAQWINVMKINEAGAVLASWQPAWTRTGAVVVDQSGPHWIGYLTDILRTVPLDMNASAQVVGRGAWAYAPGSSIGDNWQQHDEWVSYHPFIWDRGVIRELGVFGRTTNCTRTVPCASGIALDINDRGEVVGYAEDSNLVKRPFLWRNGILTDLQVLPGMSVLARAINNRGKIAGDGKGVAFLWEEGAIRILGSLGGGYTEVTAMNDAGDVVGTSLTPELHEHAFIYTDGRMIDLNVSGPDICGTKATAITGAGDVLIDVMLKNLGECVHDLNDPRLLRPTVLRAMVWHRTH